MGFPGGSAVKTRLRCRRHGRPGFDPWVGKIPWRRACQATPEFVPGESHEQRSLVGCTPWGHKELDTAKAIETVLTHIQVIPLCLWEVGTQCIPKSTDAQILSDKGCSRVRPPYSPINPQLIDRLGVELINTEGPLPVCKTRF